MGLNLHLNNCKHRGWSSLVQTAVALNHRWDKCITTQHNSDLLKMLSILCFTQGQIMASSLNPEHLWTTEPTELHTFNYRCRGKAEPSGWRNTQKHKPEMQPWHLAARSVRHSVTADPESASPAPTDQVCRVGKMRSVFHMYETTSCCVIGVFLYDCSIWRRRR